jgi:hypothetical protein
MWRYSRGVVEGGMVTIVLISVRHLVDRARHPRSRADELAKLRARFAAQPARREADPRRVALADELRELREQMASAFSDVEACHGCARGHPEPAGRWDGGHCCGGGTFRVFTQEEVAALKLAGTRPGDLTPPKGDHAGCAFRGATGCSLAPAHRPSICVRYVCMELRAELKSQPRWRRIAELGQRLRRVHEALFPSGREGFGAGFGGDPFEES